MRIIRPLLVALMVVGATTLWARDPAEVRAFKIATGYPNGRPGWVVDHVIPLCAGGADSPTNMQWQLQAASYRKDVFERALCAAMKAQGYVLVKVGQ